MDIRPKVEAHIMHPGHRVVIYKFVTGQMGAESYSLALNCFSDDERAMIETPRVYWDEHPELVVQGDLQ